VRTHQGFVRAWHNSEVLTKSAYDGCRAPPSADLAPRYTMLHDGTSNAPDKRGDSTDKPIGADDQKIASALQSLVTFISHRDHFIPASRAAFRLFQPDQAVHSSKRGAETRQYRRPSQCRVHNP